MPRSKQIHELLGSLERKALERANLRREEIDVIAMEQSWFKQRLTHLLGTVESVLVAIDATLLGGATATLDGLAQSSSLKEVFGALGGLGGLRCKLFLSLMSEEELSELEESSSAVCTKSLSGVRVLRLKRQLHFLAVSREANVDLPARGVEDKEGLLLNECMQLMQVIFIADVVKEGRVAFMEMEETEIRVDPLAMRKSRRTSVVPDDFSTSRRFHVACITPNVWEGVP